jgi:hypothetical protein
VLAFELGEVDAVGGVGDVEIEDRPNERRAAGLAGEPADDLRSPLDLAERSLEQVGRAPPAPMSCRVARVNDERVEVVGETLRRGRVARPIELVDERPQSLLAVAVAGGVIERPPVARRTRSRSRSGSLASGLRTR